MCVCICVYIKGIYIFETFCLHNIVSPGIPKHNHPIVKETLNQPQIDLKPTLHKQAKPTPNKSSSCAMITSNVTICA